MKISFFDDEPEIFPLQYGGKARTITNLAEAFAKHEDVEKVTILSRSIFSDKKTFTKNKVHYVSLNDTNTIKMIAKAANESDILNIHCCSFTFPNMETKAKKFYFLHDVLIATADKGSHMDKSLGGNFDYVIAPSEFAKKEYDKNRKIINGKTKCLVIPRHINKELFESINKEDILVDPNTPKVLKDTIKKYKHILFFPSRPIEEKGGKYLFDLANYLLEKDKETCIIGIFDNDKKLPKNCINTGWIESNKLKYFYSAADATLNLSILPESFSQICIESVYCKTPIICFNSGNIPYLSKKIDTVIISNRNTTDIYKKIKEAYKLDEKVLEENKRNIDKYFSKDTVINKYISLYKEVLGGKYE